MEFFNGSPYVEERLSLDRIMGCSPLLGTGKVLVVSKGSLWSDVVYCGLMWRCVVLCGVVWFYVALCGSMWRCVV